MSRIEGNVPRLRAKSVHFVGYLPPGPRWQFAALLPYVDLLLVEQQKVEQLRGACSAQAILAVRRRDEQMAVAPSEGDAIQIDAFHTFILSLEEAPPYVAIGMRWQ